MNDIIEQNVQEMLDISAAIRQLKSERQITRKHVPKGIIQSDSVKMCETSWAYSWGYLKKFCSLYDHDVICACEKFQPFVIFHFFGCSLIN